MKITHHVTIASGHYEMLRLRQDIWTKVKPMQSSCHWFSLLNHHNQNAFFTQS